MAKVKIEPGIYIVIYLYDSSDGDEAPRIQSHLQAIPILLVFQICYQASFVSSSSIPCQTPEFHYSMFRYFCLHAR